MHPAGSDGKIVLSSGAVFARPRLPALTAPDPEPRHGGGQVEEALWIGPGIIPNKCPPCLFTTSGKTTFALTHKPTFPIIPMILIATENRGARGEEASGYAGRWVLWLVFDNRWGTMGRKR